MPRTGRHNHPGIGIEVNNLQATYLPGDTLTGWVTYARPPVSDKPWPCPHIRLKLFGRAKTKYTVKTNNGNSIKRGRAVFFDIAQAVSTGQWCETPGEHAWSFEITIPTTSQPGMGFRGDDWKPNTDGYLATKADNQRIDVTKHPLPSIMYYHGASSMSGKTSEAYVEYVLLAQAGDRKATLPIFLRQKGTATPIANYKSQTRSSLQLVRSPRLIAEHSAVELTFRQKSSRFFRPSKTPRYTYSVKVEYPTVIQLEHPDPIPLKIAIVPDLDPEKTTICPDCDIQSLPSVHLTSISLKLKMCIDIRCPGTFWDAENDKNHDFNIYFGAALKPFPIPVISPSALKNVMATADTQSLYLYAQQHLAQTTPDLNSTNSKQQLLSQTNSTVSTANTLVPPDLTRIPSIAPTLNSTVSTTTTLVPQDLTPTQSITNTVSSASASPLHLGERYSIFLGCSASSTLGHKPISFKRQVYPTFTTYNIRLKYQLKWKFGLECAGETQEVSGIAPVTIIAPSEEQEARKKRELGTEGMKKNYDDLENGIGIGIQSIGQVLQAVL